MLKKIKSLKIVKVRKLEQYNLEFFFTSGVANKRIHKEEAKKSSFFLHSLAIGVSYNEDKKSNFSDKIMKICWKMIEQIAIQTNQHSQSILSLGLGYDSSNQDSFLFDIDCGVSIEDSADKNANDISKNNFGPEVDPAILVSQACLQVNQNEKPNLTLCAMKKDQLICASVGNAGFYLIRFYDFQKSPEIVASSSSTSYDIREDNQKIYQIQIMEGDLLITGCDDIFSNKDLLLLLENNTRKKGKRTSPKDIAENIAEEAFVRKSSSCTVIAAWISSSI